MELNKIHLCDNLELLKSLPDKSVDLIYSDILYATGSIFADYADMKWNPEDVKSFYMPRIKEMHRILKDDGSIYIHCDWHINHWIRIIMDKFFGYQNFKNEIIRQCTNAKNNSKNWGRIYDNIIFYTKSDVYTWNEMKEPKLDSSLETTYNKVDPDGERYTTVALHATGETKNGETGRHWYSKNHGLVNLPKGRHWATSHTQMEELDEMGLLEWSKNNVPRKKLYMKDYSDKHIQNFWDLKSVNKNYYDTKAYSTEKPIELLDRIIRASSNEGDVVADFFMGGGTTPVVAKTLNRKYIACDINPTAYNLTKERLERK